MWHLEEELEEWFEHIEHKRQEGRPGDSGGSWIQNDLTKDIKRY